MAGIATDDEEEERRNRDQRETRRYQRVTRSTCMCRGRIACGV